MVLKQLVKDKDVVVQSYVYRESARGVTGVAFPTTYFENLLQKSGS